MTMRIGGKGLPGHSGRIFACKFHPEDDNVLMSGGWDNTIQIYDMREGRSVGYIFGPHISGDALDVNGDLILAGSNRNKNIVQLFSLSQRTLISNIEWDPNKKDFEAGYAFAARFSKGNPGLMFVGGAGKNELKIFENNCDGSQSYRILSNIMDLESPVLSIETNKTNDMFAFGTQEGKIYFFNYKLDETMDFEGYQGKPIYNKSDYYKPGYEEEKR